MDNLDKLREAAEKADAVVDPWVARFMASPWTGGALAVLLAVVTVALLVCAGR